jgi:hypothetical protein
VGQGRQARDDERLQQILEGAERAGCPPLMGGHSPLADRK